MNSLQNPEPIEQASDARPPISGFWRRLAAFCIDCLTIGLLAHAWGLLFFDFFMGLAGWGRLVGFAIALPYSGILNSRIGGGRTLGKRLLGIKVVDEHGAAISLLRSIVRSTVFVAPVFLNNFQWPASVPQSVADAASGLIVLGLGSAIIYLAVFNRGTRQSVHDLAVGSFVVRSAAIGDVGAPAIWRGHVIVSAALCLIALVSSTILLPLLYKVGPFPELISIQRAILNSGKVRSAGVRANWGQGGAQCLAVTAIWKGRPLDVSKAAAEVAGKVLQVSPKIAGRDSLQVTVVYGYDIGIASAWRTYVHRGTPEEWQSRIEWEPK